MYISGGPYISVGVNQVLTHIEQSAEPLKTSKASSRDSSPAQSRSCRSCQVWKQLCRRGSYSTKGRAEIRNLRERRREGLGDLSYSLSSRTPPPVMRTLIVFLAVVAVTTSAAIQYPEEWHLWKSQHGKSYSVSIME